MVKYVWCEDKGSGFEFWQRIFASIDKEIVVETKKNNSQLIKAVSKIVDKDDQFYILVDNAVDNPAVLREIKWLAAASQKEKMMIYVDLINIE